MINLPVILRTIVRSPCCRHLELSGYTFSFLLISLSLSFVCVALRTFSVFAIRFFPFQSTLIWAATVFVLNVKRWWKKLLHEIARKMWIRGQLFDQCARPVRFPHAHTFILNICSYLWGKKNEIEKASNLQFNREKRKRPWDLKLIVSRAYSTLFSRLLSSPTQFHDWHTALFFSPRSLVVYILYSTHAKTLQHFWISAPITGPRVRTTHPSGTYFHIFFSLSSEFIPTIPTHCQIIEIIIWFSGNSHARWRYCGFRRTKFSKFWLNSFPGIRDLFFDDK